MNNIDWCSFIGLCFDIIGAVLLYYNGLSSSISYSHNWTKEKFEKEELKNNGGKHISKNRYTEALSGLGLWLLILGFALQSIQYIYIYFR